MAKPHEEIAVELELVRIAAEFAEHGIASIGGLLGDLGTLLGDDLQRWLYREEEPAEAEAEEEASEAPHACPICCVQVEDHEEPASFACYQKTLYHADCVRKAALPSLMSCPDCGTAPDEAPTDPAIMAEGMPTRPPSPPSSRPSTWLWCALDGRPRARASVPFAEMGRPHAITGGTGARGSARGSL
jgi:hypothetical protein